MAYDIEYGDRERGCCEEWKVDEQHLEPALIEAHDHGGDEKRGHDDHERIAHVGREMVDGFDLDAARNVGAEHHGQDFDGGLDESLGPARLLGFEGGHFDGQLGWAFDFGEIFEFPAGHLGAVTEVGIFGEGVVLPASGVGDGFAPPHAGCAVEVEEISAAGAGAVL